MSRGGWKVTIRDKLAALAVSVIILLATAYIIGAVAIAFRVAHERYQPECTEIHKHSSSPNRCP